MIRPQPGTQDGWRECGCPGGREGLEGRCDTETQMRGKVKRRMGRKGNGKGDD